MRNFIIFFFTISTFFFTACEREQIDKNDFSARTILEAVSKESNGKGETYKEECFALIFPVTIMMPDGSTISGEEEELMAAMKAWYASHPNAKEKPALEYPVVIKWAADKFETIASENAMIAAKKECEGYESGYKECVKFVYPISFTMPDGATIAMQHSDDWDAIKAWYEANPTVKDDLLLNYPVEIILEDGSTQAITNDAAMEAAKKDC